ncbi:acetylcholine receptor subunit alpha-like [Ceratitis capitata]|nr:acetylcholine receptor subunit alpha-like [Ceratitis capitata]XP_023158684.1 acetylcholine receptor subunit alpha-like [Ceratitis capitata]XP_023158685.1 acetylcholine receptor subunit alpha-like [Ceratitis capitata]
MKWFQVALDMFLVLSFITSSTSNPDAKRLYDDLLSNYNKLVRPVVNVTDAVTVRIKLKLSQLIDVNLKNQIMTTNLWVEQTWYDYKLQWEPKEYGGVEMLHVPSDHIWRPDIVLYNNADGNFEVTLATKATLNYTGRVEWRPPAIYKSSCEIDVEYFPFDEQTCVMKFGSWTYDGFQVDLRHIDELNGTNVVEVGVDLSEFYTSVEWDILEVPAVRNEKFYTCCDEPYLDITFNITMRRKTLFYTVNLIIPCMGISFLTILVFYLPSDSGEKVSLSISILLSLTVFFLLLAEIIPPTSLVVPLLGKFVLFTMILDTFSICVTVVVLNIHFRSPQTHTMAPWVRTVFINQLPRFLVMRRPLYPISEMIKSSRRLMVRTCNGFELGDQIPPVPPPAALSRMHHSPKTTSRSTSPHLQHRVQSLNLLDDTTIGGLGMTSTGTASAGQFSTLYPSTISTVNQQTSTTSSLVDAQHHSQYQQTGGSLLDHPLTPTKFRQQKTSTSVQTNGFDGPSTSQFGRLYQQHQQQLPSGAISASTSTLHHVHTHSVGVGAGIGIGVGYGAASTSTHHLYRQQSASSAQFSPVPAPLHPHQQHQSTTTCDLLGHSNANVIKSTTTVNSVATASTLADSCCSGIQIHQGAGAGAACQSSEQLPHQYTAAAAGVSGQGGVGGALPREILPACQREDGAHCCLAAESEGCPIGNELRQRWPACPELLKAMEGVSYIAEQTRKEEESTRVKEDWKYVAMVLDRLFLWLFTIAVVVGTAGIILQAPTLYDTRVPIDIKLSEIATTTAKPSIAKPVL